MKFSLIAPSAQEAESLTPTMELSGLKPGEVAEPIPGYEAAFCPTLM